MGRVVPSPQESLDLLFEDGPRVEFRLPDGASRSCQWGQPWQYGTAAYWVAATDIAIHLSHKDISARRSHRLGETLLEEVVACLLGGHGITYETNIAAFYALKERGLLQEARCPDPEEILAVLMEPLACKDGGPRRYRFPNQKADRISGAIRFVESSVPPSTALEMREWLMNISGVGYKTASWICRNYLDSDEFAIIDIHILRAGVTAGVFDPGWSPSRDYLLLENLFLQWAEIGSVPAGELDAVMWMEQARHSRHKR